MISIFNSFKSFKKSSAPLFLLPQFLYSIASAQTASPETASPAIPKSVVFVISRSEMESDMVSGPGKQTSFYKNGTFYNEELEFLGEMILKPYGEAYKILDVQGDQFF